MAASPDSRATGDVLAGRVELLDPIGEGGAGVIWRARDLRSGLLVAAKVLRQADAGGLLRFVQESSTEIQHPHVLAPLTWVAEDGRVALLMELVEGGSVASLVGDYGALPPLLVAELLRQACEALTAVHDAGVVHRDITPSNLLLQATGAGRPHLLVSDFGVAGRVDGPRFTHTAFSVGTLGYAAPEQLRGADPSPAQDLFSLGRVGEEMLTGVRPRAEGTDAEGADLPRDIPPVLRDIVRSLTSRDPQDRPASAADARARLEHPDLAWRTDALGDVEVLNHFAVSDDSTPEPHPAAAGGGRGPLVALLLLVMLLSAVLLVWTLTQLF